jgi:hypothetical protein
LDRVDVTLRSLRKPDAEMSVALHDLAKAIKDLIVYVASLK